MHGLLSDVLVSRAHYWHGDNLTQIFYKGFVHPDDLPERIRNWRRAWWRRWTEDSFLCEVKYHQILKSDEENNYIISWSYSPENHMCPCKPKPNAKTISDLNLINDLSGQRVALGLVYPVTHIGMEENLGFENYMTGNTEHYPELNHVDIID